MAQQLTMLVDAASLIYRALFSTPDSIRGDDGTPMNAAYGFLGMLARLITDHDPDFICCAADDDWRPEWRVAEIASYKSLRAEPGSAQESAEDLLEPQMVPLLEILQRCGIPVVGQPNYEAEDVIGTLAARAPKRVAIVSGDRDLFQLVRDPDIYVLYPRRGVSQLDTVSEDYIAQKYGIPGDAYRDFAILRGDPSDGLPGVRGIGEKLASALISRYGSLDGVLKAIDDGEQGTALGKVRRDRDYVTRAVKVVTIPTDLSIPDVDLNRPRETPDDALDIVKYAKAFALDGATRRLLGALTG